MKQITRKHGRDTLSAAIAIALFAVAAVPGAAFAQQASTTSTDATTLDSVNVTGYRYAIEKSLEQKRDANAVVEVITAEDVGKFPDKNVADALQRQRTQQLELEHTACARGGRGGVDLGVQLGQCAARITKPAAVTSSATRNLPAPQDSSLRSE